MAKLKIGKLILSNNVIAAPMAGFTDAVWRKLAIECGAGLVFSEMISVEGLVRAQKKTVKYLKNFDNARPFGVQLFGSNPGSFAGAFDVLKKFCFDSVDINMGCPVKKVVARGAGAALMKSPENVKAIVSEVRRVYSGPLTVKMRSGWDSLHINAIEIAKIAEGSGADAVIVHGRTREQGFKDKADWGVVANVKRAVKIPVIGNGDVVDKKSADDMFARTGCDGIMIGRAAICNPWLFGGMEKEWVWRHIELLQECKDERYAISVTRKFLPRYFKGVTGSRELIRETATKKTIQEVLDCLKVFKHLDDDGY